MKKIFLILVFVILAAASVAAEKENSGHDKSDAGRSIAVEGKGVSSSENIDDLVPEKTSYISLPLLLAFDFFVPGAGHFYQENYWLGSGFVALKITGAWSIYYFYNQWTFYRSLYHSAKKANQDIDPDHDLLFNVPGKGYKTVDQIKGLYDRSAQNITFAVVGNVLVYTVSLVLNYVYYKKNAVDTIPTFNLALTTVTTENDFTVSLGYTSRF